MPREPVAGVLAVIFVTSRVMNLRTDSLDFVSVPFIKVDDAVDLICMSEIYSSCSNETNVTRRLTKRPLDDATSPSKEVSTAPARAGDPEIEKIVHSFRSNHRCEFVFKRTRSHKGGGGPAGRSPNYLPLI
ncbi:hypothetical protein EVAR_18768_1 [Eumeta japonica]|uniref:Uncharacterized protein n=1 Tax=Eumeta variegata TaxID=151549 RepID=A0A4C1UM85_EUMVA|nr:hypothetical protein EVAR_18768_1 [Eumeta japonica]